MKSYKILNFLGLRKSYSLKFLFTAFIGIHIPLIGLVFFLVINPPTQLNVAWTLATVLVCTLIATLVTLLILNDLLAPIRMATKTMGEFESFQTIMEVPVKYSDEAGLLLRQINNTLFKIKTLTEERNDFIGLITHDLRNPFANTIGLSSLIKEFSNDKETMKYADMIHQCGDNGLKIISDIMSILKADNYSIETSQYETILLKSFIQEQFDEVNANGSSKNIRLVINVDEKQSIKVHLVFFTHIIQNLLSNTIKFSPNNSQVEVYGEQQEDGYQLQIRDHGIGFDPENSDKIFEKFTSAKRKGTNNEPTTGLGLFLTKMLVKKHRGQINATSEGLNKGALFTIKI